MHDTSATGNATDGVTRVAQGTAGAKESRVHRICASIGPAGGATLPWTVEISNTSAYSNY